MESEGGTTGGININEESEGETVGGISLSGGDRAAAV